MQKVSIGYNTKMDTQKNIFKNREDGAKALLSKLPIKKMKLQKWIVIAMSAGGYEIAKIIAKKIDADVDFILTKKIKSDINKECTLGVVSETKDVIVHQELASSFEVDLEQIYKKANKEYETSLLKSIKKYKPNRKNLNFKGRSVLLVDDGLQTSITAMVCIKSAINQDAKSVSIAIPVLPSIVVDELEAIADDLYYAFAPDSFLTLKSYYKSFKKVIYKEKTIINN